MVLCDGGPPTMERLAAPDQSADPRANQLVEIKLKIRSSVNKTVWSLVCFDYMGRSTDVYLKPPSLWAFSFSEAKTTGKPKC